MNILHEKRKMLPQGNPQEPISAVVAAMGLSGAAATIATGAITGGLISAVTGGNFLKGALAGALFAGVGEAFSAASGASGSGVTAAAGKGTELTASKAVTSGLDGAAGIGSGTGIGVPAVGEGLSLTAPVAPPVAAPVSVPTTGLAGATQSTLSAPVTGTGIQASVGQQLGGGGGSGLLGKISLGLGDKTGAALVTAGGQALAGYAQGKQQEELYNRQQANAKFAKPVGRGLLAVG